VDAEISYVQSIRFAMMPTLLARADASSIESRIEGFSKTLYSSNIFKELTGCDHDSLPHSHIPQGNPHVPFHLGVNTG
jgi:hypothetical protein